MATQQPAAFSRNPVVRPDYNHQFNVCPLPSNPAAGLMSHSIAGRAQKTMTTGRFYTLPTSLRRSTGVAGPHRPAPINLRVSSAVSKLKHYFPVNFTSASGRINSTLPAVDVSSLKGVAETGPVVGAPQSHDDRRMSLVTSEFRFHVKEDTMSVLYKTSSIKHSLNYRNLFNLSFLNSCFNPLLPE